MDDLATWVRERGIAEVECLVPDINGVLRGKVLPAAKLLGLRPLQALAQGTLTRAEALDGAITATRQFAKRQMTWFRHRMPHYIWYDPYLSNLITQFRHISA